MRALRDAPTAKTRTRTSTITIAIGRSIARAVGMATAGFVVALVITMLLSR